MVITALVPIFGCPTGGQGQANLEGRVQALEGQVASLNATLAAVEAKLAHISVEQGDINGVNGPHLIIEGCNLHVRDGSSTTDDDDESLNGLGNLIVGYNEPSTFPEFGRNGSHNVVIGEQHEYSSYGGLVAGIRNQITGQASTVSSGIANVASGGGSSVSGGNDRTAADADDWVAGTLFEDN
jgi:hypothetical protein